MNSVSALDGGFPDSSASFGGGHGAGGAGADHSSVHANNSSPFTKISYAEALAHVQGLDLSVHKDTITIRDTDRSTNSFITMLSRPCELKFDNCETLLAFPFLLAQVDYEPGYPDLFTIMRSIFQGLTDITESGSETRECPRTGPRWEQIGANNTKGRCLY